MKGPDSKDTKEFHQELFDLEDEMIDFINNMKQKSIKKSDQGKVLQFLKKNPNPPDKKIHALADRLGIEPDKLESKIYSILSDVIEHGKGEKVDSKELSMGVEIESEHTKYPELAEAIARTHLKEIPDYYTRLKRMEAEYKKETKKAIYPGNMGFAEMYRFMSEAQPGAVSRFNWYLKHDKYHDAIKLLESHISNKFHPSIEKQLLPSHKDPHVKRWMHVIQKAEDAKS